MSKILQCNENDTCTTWQAPRFEAGGAQGASVRTRGQREHAEQQAYEKAFTQGHQEGLEQGKNEVQQQFACLQSVMQALAEPLQNLDEQVINELVELSMLVAGQLIRRELKTSPGEVVATVKDALKLLPVATSDVRLELHPEDAATVRESLSGSEADRNWKIIEDPLLSRGGCKVTTDTSCIDATIESRLNAAIVAVLGSERKSG